MPKGDPVGFRGSASKGNRVLIPLREIIFPDCGGELSCQLIARYEDPPIFRACTVGVSVHDPRPIDVAVSGFGESAKNEFSIPGGFVSLKPIKTLGKTQSRTDQKDGKKGRNLFHSTSLRA